MSRYKKTSFCINALKKQGNMDSTSLNKYHKKSIPFIVTIHIINSLSNQNSTDGLSLRNSLRNRKSRSLGNEPNIRIYQFFVLPIVKSNRFNLLSQVRSVIQQREWNSILVFGVVFLVIKNMVTLQL